MRRLRWKTPRFTTVLAVWGTYLLRAEAASARRPNHSKGDNDKQQHRNLAKLLHGCSVAGDGILLIGLCSIHCARAYTRIMRTDMRAHAYIKFVRQLRAAVPRFIMKAVPCCAPASHNAPRGGHVQSASSVRSPQCCSGACMSLSGGEAVLRVLSVDLRVDDVTETDEPRCASNCEYKHCGPPHPVTAQRRACSLEVKH
jgi:hypothetical protein